MSTTTTLARRNLAANKWRLALTAFSVVLGVGFVSGSFMLRDSLKDVFSTLAGDINAAVDLQVRAKVEFGDTNNRSPVPAALVDTVRSVAGVEAAEGNINAFGVTIIGKDGKAKLPSGPTIGSPWIENRSVSTSSLADGRAPKTRDEIVLDRDAAPDTGYRIGDTVKLAMPTGEKRSFQLVGTFTFGPENRTAGAYLIGFDAATASEQLGLNGAYQTIDIHVSDPTARASVERAIATQLPVGFEIVDQATLIQESKDQFGGGIDGFSNGLLAFALVALFVSCFIINNTFAILTTQRMRELALLRALGASSTQIQGMMAIEALFIGVLASLVGLGFGAFIATVLKLIFSTFVGDLPGGLIVTATPIITGIAVGVFVTLVAAMTPALKAGRIPPIAAMSAQQTLDVGHPRLRLVLSLASVIGGSGFLLVGLFARPGEAITWLSLAGAGAIGLFLGLAALSRLIARPVITAESRLLRLTTRALSWPATKLLRRERQGMIATLGRENLVRTPRRTAAAAAALMIGLALVSAGSVVGSSIKSTLNAQLGTSITADLFIQDKGFAGVTNGTIEAVGKLDGIRSISGFSAANVQLEGNEKTAGVVDHDAFGELVDIGLVRGSWADLGPDTVLLHEDLAAELGANLGAELAARWPSGRPSTLRVVGIYTDESVIGTRTIIDRSTFDTHVGGLSLNFFAAATVDDGFDVNEVQTAVKTYLIDNAPAVNVQDREEFQKSQETLVNIFIGIINVLLLLAIVIAFIGIANTLALSIYERTRELGLLRAVGMQRRQTRTMVRWESVLVALFGALLGTAVGVLLGALVSIALPESFVNTVTVPVPLIIGYLVASVIFGMIAAFFPARRASRLNILDAIAHQ